MTIIDELNEAIATCGPAPKHPQLIDGALFITPEQEAAIIEAYGQPKYETVAHASTSALNTIPIVVLENGQPKPISGDRQVINFDGTIYIINTEATKLL